jgi:hypothetical protein
MRPIMQNFSNWPRARGGEPIFRTTNDALLFAQYASRVPTAIEELKALRAKAHRDLRNERSKTSPSVDRMFGLAVKAQFFREGYMEIQRILDEEAGVKHP